ncbi:30S ribosomal protein S18 [Patescibacteria group bacterium]|nr:30S ribosomal protein S18 [Patescibacteria group bacterium]
MIRRRRLFQRRVRDCSFCVSKTHPDYKKVEDLGQHLTDRGKIIGRGRSGLCAKHQRRLAQAVKRARHLALLPFTQRV